MYLKHSHIIRPQFVDDIIINKKANKTMIHLRAGQGSGVLSIYQLLH